MGFPFFSSLSCFGDSSTRRVTNRSSFDPTLISTEPPSSIITELCHQFTLAEIQSVTRNFEKSLGESRFGIVHRGYVGDTSKPVAVKKYKKDSGFGFLEFKNEVVLLSQLHHPNLISLVGFCVERNELILVNELLSKGNLYRHLHGRNIRPLPWKRRLQICIGVARGLHYLHTGAKYIIIHHDIKTNNILLDDNLEPKISGLTLSKRVSLRSSKSLKRTESDIKGTYGYKDPEYERTGVLTEKSDVYSFGVVLLEVLTAKPPREIYREHLENCNQSLESYAEKNVDQFLKSKIAPECWKIFVDITERCLKAEGRERPDMGEVEVELEHALQFQEEADVKNFGSDNSYRI